MICRNCGNPLGEGQTFCGRCGTIAEPPHKNRKKTAIVTVSIITAIAILGIVLAIVFSGNPEEDMSMLRYAVNNENTDYFMSHVRFTSGETMDEEMAEEFLAYLSSDEDARTDFFRELAMGDYANAVNVGSLFSKEYVFGIRPRYVYAKANKNYTTFYYHEKKLGTLEIKEEELKLGPFFRCQIELKAKNKKWQEPVTEQVDFADTNNMQIELTFSGEDKIQSNLKKNQKYYMNHKYPIGIFSGKTLSDKSLLDTIFVGDCVIVKKILSPTVVSVEALDSGRTGYVNSSYFIEDYVAKPLYYVTDVSDYLTMHVAPDISSKDICRIPPNRKVEILSYANKECCFVKFESYEGYVSTKYLEPVYSDTATYRTGGYDNTYSLNDSDTCEYSEEYFEYYYSDDLWVLCVMRNEIYARYGYTFNQGTSIGKRLQDHFNTKSWYVPNYSVNANHMPTLNAVEKKNAEAIRKVEERHHSPYIR